MLNLLDSELTDYLKDVTDLCNDFQPKIEQTVNRIKGIFKDDPYMRENLTI